MANYLVTGGCGFLGAQLSRALIAGGHAVRLIDDPASGSRENAPRHAEVLVGDPSDAGFVHTALQGAHGCFHLMGLEAGTGYGAGWTHSHRSAMSASVAVFEAISRLRESDETIVCPVVIGSSAMVYGPGFQRPIAESESVAPISAHGIDMLGTELYAQCAAAYGVSSIGLRFFELYGPGEDPTSGRASTIARMTLSARTGREIRLPGHLSDMRDYVYVDDAVEALLAAMERLHYQILERNSAVAEVYNVCSGIGHSLADVIGLVGVALRGEPVVEMTALPEGRINYLVGEPEGMHSVLRVAAEVKLEEGIRRMSRQS